MNDGGTQDPAHLELMRLLATGRERLFKVWRLLPRWMSWAAGAAGAAVLVGLLGLLAWACYLMWDAPIAFSGRILVILLAIFAVLFVMLRIPAVRRQALRLALGGSLFSGGGLAAGLNVCLMTPIYLRLGSLRRLQKFK